MSKKSGCPARQEKYGGRCIPVKSVKLNETQAEVLYNKLDILVENKKVNISYKDNLTARRMFGKPVVTILYDVKKKVDKIRP